VPRQHLHYATDTILHYEMLFVNKRIAIFLLGFEFVRPPPFDSPGGLFPGEGHLFALDIVSKTLHCFSAG